MDATYFESLYKGAPMHKTMGLSRTCGLCIILGNPYILGGHELDGMIPTVNALRYFPVVADCELSWLPGWQWGPLVASSGVVKHSFYLFIVVARLHHHRSVHLVSW